MPRHQLVHHYYAIVRVTADIQAMVFIALFVHPVTMASVVHHHVNHVPLTRHHSQVQHHRVIVRVQLVHLQVVTVMAVMVYVFHVQLVLIVRYPIIHVLRVHCIHQR
jgi:hypothetical protein